jgi:hypothetical protein
MARTTTMMLMIGNTKLLMLSLLSLMTTLSLARRLKRTRMQLARRLSLRLSLKTG